MGVQAKVDSNLTKKEFERCGWMCQRNKERLGVPHGRRACRRGLKMMNGALVAGARVQTKTNSLAQGFSPLLYIMEGSRRGEREWPFQTLLLPPED